MTATTTTTPAPVAEREARLTDSLRKLRTGASSGQYDHVLLRLGAVLLPLGLMLILLGWYGASHTTLQFEQTPYLISGGLLGLGLVIAGGFIYFGYWIMRLAREMRTQSEAVTKALESLQEAMAQDAAPASTRRTRPLQAVDRLSAKS